MTNSENDQTMGDLGANQAEEAPMLLDSLEKSGQAAGKAMRGDLPEHMPRKNRQGRRKRTLPEKAVGHGSGGQAL